MRQTVTNASMDTLPYPIVVIGYAYKCVKNTSPASPVYDFMASPSGGFNLNSHNQVISFPRVAKTVFRIRRIPSSTANLFKPAFWSGAPFQPVGLISVLGIAVCPCHCHLL